MWDYVKLIALGAVAVLAAIAASYARDLAYQVNAIEIMIAAGIAFLWVLRHTGPKVAPSKLEYMDDVIAPG